MSPSWNPDDCKIPAAKLFVSELNKLADEYAQDIERYTGARCIAIKIRNDKKKKKLIEYWPNDNIIKRTLDDHGTTMDDGRHLVPENLKIDYHSTIDNLNHGKVEESTIPVFIELLRKIIEALPSKISASDRPQSQPDRSNDPKNLGLYLPKWEDFENACRRYEKEQGRDKVDVPIDNILDLMEENLKNTGHKLLQSWRLETEKNIEIWLERKDRQ